MLEEGSTDGVLTHDKIENCMLVTMPSVGEETWTPRATMQRPGDCWQDKILRFKDAVPNEGKTIFRRIEIYDVTSRTEANPQGTETLRETKYQIALRPFDVDGTAVVPNAADEKGELSEAAFDALSAAWVVRPYLMTWARITRDHVFPGNAGKVFTVDMVPATYEDDKAFNGVDNTRFDMANFNLVLGNSRIENEPANPSPQRAMPIMRFPSGMTFRYSDVKEAATSGSTKQVPAGEWSVKACYAVDPRFNWAPENWWFDSSADLSGQRWHDAVFVNGGTSGKGILDDLVQAEYGGGFGRGDRANDPFLFVSNLGYLQSVGELAFLPHLSDMHESNAPECILGDSKQDIDNSSHQGRLYDGKERKIGDVSTMPCALAAWKSYQNYRTNPALNTFEFGANLYRRGLVNDPQGFYINPYTQSQEIMLAALANTPLDYYWAAGRFGNAANTTTGSQGNPDQGRRFSEGKLYMFSNARMSGRDVNKIATFLRRRFEDLAAMIEVPSDMNMHAYGRVWEDMFDALDWSGTAGCTVKDVYKGLERYYSGGGSSARNYCGQYIRANDYSDLNQFVLGGGARNVDAGISLNVERAVHKNDFDLDADPLRGRYSGDDGDTACCDTLHDVDRMFLHSYWRDCFANKQQLFLIFVRAESTALGGAGEGTPAQQGGRAVALVWRDPMPPTVEDVYENNDKVYHKDRHPHKMRVLFYRQFD